MYCALSGEAVREGVVSRRSGHIFERRLLERYLEESGGVCPVTGETLDKEADLIAVQSAAPAVRPRAAVAAASVPGLLSLLQQEWDDVMLETFALKKQLHETKRDLAHALYQHDAACRAIARLIRERDEARAALEAHDPQQQPGAEAAAAAAAAVSAATNGNSSSGNGAGERTSGKNDPEEQDKNENENENENGNGLPSDVAQELADVAKTLLRQRQRKQKQKKATSGALRTKEQIEQFSTTAQHTLHQASGRGGVLCLDLHPAHPELVATGGTDKSVVICNLEDGLSLVSRISGAHSKKVTTLKFHPDTDKHVLLTGSADRKVKVWAASALDADDWSVQQTLAHHTKDVVAVDFHPAPQYFATASKDGTWAFCDIARGDAPIRIFSTGVDGTTAPVLCAEFHPDGQLLATGSGEDGAIRVWDVNSSQLAATLLGDRGEEDGATWTSVPSLSFSQNGYYLAAAYTSASGSASVAKIWDLRNQECLQTLSLGEGPVNHVAFDASGKYLAISADDVCVTVVKGWDSTLRLTSHSKAVTSARFGPDASFLVSCSADRSVQLHTTPTSDAA